jgi:hypothetical protein
MDCDVMLLREQQINDGFRISLIRSTKPTVILSPDRIRGFAKKIFQAVAALFPHR